MTRKLLFFQMWCHENFLNFRNLNYACEVRKQLVQVCERCGVAITSCQQKTDSVRRWVTFLL